MATPGYDYYDSGDDYDAGSNLLMSTEEECIMCNRTSRSTLPPSIHLATPSGSPSSPPPLSNNLLACTVCDAAIYCSVECQLEDEPVHKLLCGTRKQFDQRPHPNARRAIVFEHDAPVVRFAWVDIVDVDGEALEVEEKRGRTLGSGVESRRSDMELHVPTKYDRALLDEYLGYGPGTCASRGSSSSGVASRSSSCTTTSRSASTTSDSNLHPEASDAETNTTLDSSNDDDSKDDLLPPLSPSPSESPSVDSDHGGQILCGVNVIRDRELKEFLSIRFRANFVEDTNPSSTTRSTSRLPTVGSRAPSSSRSPSSSSPHPSPFSKPNAAVAHVAPAHGGSVYCGPLVALKHKSPLWEERITDMDMRDLRDLVDYLIYYGMDKRVLYQPGPTMSTSWNKTGKVNNQLQLATQGLKEGNGNLVDEYSWSTGGVTIVGELQDLSSSDEFKRALACPGETVLSKAWSPLTR